MTTARRNALVPPSLAQDFAAWVSARQPTGWDGSLPRMRKLVVMFLRQRFPAEHADRLAELAAAHVNATDRRLSIDMQSIVDGLAN